MQNLEKRLNDIGIRLVAEIAKELLAQGHKATGKLVDSLFFSVQQEAGGMSLLIYSSASYAVWVDSGRKPGKYVPIQALIRWVQIKALDAKWHKTAEQVAWAINKTIYRQGIPTHNSLQYSSTGKRTGFLADTLARLDTYIRQEVASALGEAFEEEMGRVLKA